jgi:hypothetical protein
MGQGNVKITNSNDHNITVTYWMSRVILSVLNFEFRSLVFVWARPGLRLVDPTPRRARLDWFLPPSVAGFQLEVINTVSVYPVWARDLFFGAWNFHDFHKRATLFIPSNYLFRWHDTVLWVPRSLQVWGGSKIMGSDSRWPMMYRFCPHNIW